MLSLIRDPKRSVVLETVATAIAIAAALYSACPSAFADERGGGGPGNGGDAVLIGGKWTLLDLAEAGITKSPSFDDARARMKKYHAKPGSSLMRGLVNDVFIDPRFTPAFREALAATLEYSYDQASLVGAMRLYQWQVTSAPLRQIGDEHSTLDLAKMKTVQLAVRLDDRIQIYGPVFFQMDLLNQVATIHHELKYALANPLRGDDGKLYQPSWEARSQVACEFSGRKGCTDISTKKYPNGNFVFEGSVMTEVDYLAHLHDSDGSEYPMYGSHPDLVVCDRITEKLSLRNPRSRMLSGTPIEENGQPSTHCTDLGGILGHVYGATDAQARMRLFGGVGADWFCRDNSRGQNLKKESGSMFFYHVANVALWKFEELETPIGTNRRPVLVQKSPGLESMRSNFVAEKKFGSYDECVKNVGDALNAYVQRIQRDERDLFRNFAD